MSIYNETSLTGWSSGSRDFPKATYLDYSLPKAVGKQVVLCTRDGNYHGHLSKVGQDSVVIRNIGRDKQIKIDSIYAIVSQD